MINTDDTKTTPTYRRPDSQPQSYVTFDPARPVLRHKMYKAGKLWVTAGVVGLATTAGSVMVMGTAHADTTGTTGSTAATTTTGASSTSAYTQVNVDSSGVQKAAASASAAGVKVTQTQGTTYNAQGSAQLNSATSAVASHYAAETSALASATTQAQNSTAVSEAVTAMNSATSAAVASASAAGVRVSTTPTSTVKVGANGESVAQAQADVASAQAQASAAIAKLNTATSDTIATKSAVASGNAQIASAATSASSTPGLTVTKASSSVSVSSVDEAKSAAASQIALLSQATSTQASNNAAVAAANKQLSDAASAAKAAGVAVKAGEAKVYSSVAEAQKAAASEAAVLADRASIATKSDNGGTINTSDIIQQLQIGNEDHATLTVSDVKGATVNKATKLFWGDFSTYAYTFVPSEKQGTITVTATYTGLTKSSYTDANGVTHQISKIVRTFKWDGSTTPAQTTGTVDGVKGVTFFINNQPQEGFGYYGGTVTETDQFYDQNGNLITIGPNAYISVSSLNSTTNGDSVTAGTVLGGGWSVKNGRVEGAKGVDNVVLKPIQGSSVRLDSKTGWLNAPEGNDSICVGFGDKTGKYSYVGNGGKTLYNLTLNESSNWVVGDAILQGTGENGTVTSTDIWNAGYAWWDGSNGAAGNTQYFGAAAGEIDPGSTSITVAFYTNGELLDSGNYWGTWAMVSTTIPSSPTTTYNPVAVTGTSVSYSNLTWTPHDTPSDYAVNKYESGYTPVSATVSYDTINYTPETQKNVTETKGGKATSVDSDQVVKGDTMQYTVTTSDLPANRTASVNNVTFTDTLPDGFKMTSAKIFNQKGEDITSEFIFTQDGQKITFNGSNTEMLTAMNLNKSESYKMPYLVITGTVNADGADLVNKAFVNVNDTNVGSNTVETHTPKYDPTKSETANGGTEDANGKILQLGDTINYKVTADYSEVNSKTSVSDTAKAKGLSIYDTYDAETTPVQSSLKITHTAGKTVPTSAYSVKWDTANHRVTVTWNNVDSFLATYGGQKLALTFDAKINSDTKAAYTIKNTAYQVNFGETYPTNTVTNTVIRSNPTKTVSEDGNGENADGKIVQKGNTINYGVTLDLTGITATNTMSQQRAKGLGLTDTYDANTTVDAGSAKLVDASGKAVATNLYTVKNDAAKHTLTLTVNDPAAFLKTYGNQKLTVAFNAKLNSNVNMATESIKNTAVQNTFGQHYDTNTVTLIPDQPDPTKSVTENGGTADANGMLAQKGDTLNYKWTWDLTKVTDQTTTAAQQALTWNTYDTYDAQTTAVQDSLTVKTAKGEVVTTSAYSVKWDATNHKVTIMPTNVKDFLTKYGDQVLTVAFNATPNQDIKDGYVIKNTAFQTQAGQLYATNTVVNPVDVPDPVKTVTENGGTADANGKIVQTADVLNYKWTWDLSSVKASNTTSEQQAKTWNTYDTYDAQTTAATSSLVITTAKGAVVPTSAYTVNWDATTHTVTITPTNVKDFLTKYGDQVLTVAFNATLNKGVDDGYQVKNTAYQTDAGQKYTTNTVVNPVEIPDPFKSVTENGESEDANGKIVQKSDILNYKWTWDLSGVSDQTTTSEQQVKVWNTYDNYDANTTAVQNSIKVTTAKGEVVLTSAYSVKWDAMKHSVTITPTDNAAFLKAYGNQKLVVSFNATVNDGVATGTDVKNVAFQTDAGQVYESNTVTNPVITPDPQKKVTENGSSDDANGVIVQQGDVLNYSWTWDLKGVKTANTTVGQRAKTWNTYDTYDAKTTADQASLTVKTAKGDVVPSDAYKVTWDATNHKVTITPTDVASFIEKYGNQALTVAFNATLNADVKDGDVIKNTAFQTQAGTLYQTNTVTNPVDIANPTKSETVDNSGTDGNGKLVVEGNMINYKITWDLSGVTDKNTSATQQAADWSLVDTYDAKTTADQSSVTIMDASGKTLPADAYKVSFDTTKQVMTITPTNVKDFLAKYGNQVLTVAFNAVVNDNLKDGDVIANTAYQVNAGHKYTTETVTNKVTVPNPTKDVVISVDNTKSMNNSEIILGEEFDYELNGGVIPQNYGGKLSEYGFKDDYDQEHDQYNGQYTVLADQDIHLTDGTVIVKGTSLNQYVTQSIDQENGEVTLEFNKSFLDQIDFSKGGFSASAYLAMKRIKAGTVYNVFTNTVNGKDYKSNTVKTTTPEPKAPETPDTPTPQKLTPSNPTTPDTPTPLVATPAPAAATPTPTATPSQQTLPQTGAADEAGLVGLGLAGFLMSLGVLGASKKRKQV